MRTSTTVTKELTSSEHFLADAIVKILSERRSSFLFQDLLQLLRQQRCCFGFCDSFSFGVGDAEFNIRASVACCWRKEVFSFAQREGGATYIANSVLPLALLRLHRDVCTGLVLPGIAHKKANELSRTEDCWQKSYSCAMWCRRWSAGQEKSIHWTLEFARAAQKFLRSGSDLNKVAPN